MTRETKKHLLKLVLEYKMPWIQLLPLALVQIQLRLRERIQLSPFELMFGPPYPVNSQSSREVETSDVYVKQYTARTLSLVKSLQQEAQLAQNTSLDFAVHNIQPGDWVLLKDWKEAPLVARWHSPYHRIIE